MKSEQARKVLKEIKNIVYYDDVSKDDLILLKAALIEVVNGIDQKINKNAKDQ